MPAGGLSPIHPPTLVAAAGNHSDPGGGRNPGYRRRGRLASGRVGSSPTGALSRAATSATSTKERTRHVRVGGASVFPRQSARLVHQAGDVHPACQTPKTAPVGSVAMNIRPKGPTSPGGSRIAPPCSATAAAVSSASAAPRNSATAYPLRSLGVLVGPAEYCGMRRPAPSTSGTVRSTQRGTPGGQGEVRMLKPVLRRSPGSLSGPTATTANSSAGHVSTASPAPRVSTSTDAAIRATQDKWLTSHYP